MVRGTLGSGGLHSPRTATSYLTPASAPRHRTGVAPAKVVTPDQSSVAQISGPRISFENNCVKFTAGGYCTAYCAFCADEIALTERATEKSTVVQVIMSAVAELDASGMDGCDAGVASVYVGGHCLSYLAIGLPIVLRDDKELQVITNQCMRIDTKQQR